MRIHIHVTHLLGSGHLVRMQTLAAAFARAGHKVTLFSGGMPTAKRATEYELVQLPPVQTAPGDFTTLLDAERRPISDAHRARRRDWLLRYARENPPDAALLETYPFGRRVLRFELQPLTRLLRELRPRPLLFCSARDILQPRSDKRNRETVRAVRECFDHVLVHSDAAVVKLEESFAPAGELGDAVFYSGYVYQGGGDDAGDGQDEIIVSAGGGAVGLQLLQTAIAARRLSRFADVTWRLLAGASLPADEFFALQQRAGEGVIVQRNRADFAALLARCKVSVSQAGYNTVMDAAAAGCRSLLVPFAAGGEREQTMRADIFARLGRAVVLAEDALTPARLADAIARAAELDVSQCRAIDMNGAENSARFLEMRLASR